MNELWGNEMNNNIGVEYEQTKFSNSIYYLKEDWQQSRMW